MHDGVSIKCLKSSSAGNCFVLSDSKTTILLECGISLKDIQKGLGFKLSSISGCILTHGHNDHSNAVRDLMKNGVNCYMSTGTAAELDIDGYRAKKVTPEKQFMIGTFTVIGFDVQHDAQEPLGYVVKSMETGEALLFATDTFYISYRFKNITHYLIECNYITERLQNSNTPPDLLKRLYQSHFSLENCIKFLKVQDLANCKKIMLCHISNERGDAQYMKRMVERATGCIVEIAH